MRSASYICHIERNANGRLNKITSLHFMIKKKTMRQAIYLCQWDILLDQRGIKYRMDVSEILYSQSSLLRLDIAAIP